MKSLYGGGHFTLRARNRFGLRPVRLTAAFLLTAQVIQAEPASVSEADLASSVARLDAAEQAALTRDPRLHKQVVQLMVAQRLLLQEARNNKWDERPDVQAKMERAREAALAESWLQSVAAPPAEFPNGEELKAAYEARRDSFATPRQYRLAQIFIACPKGADKAAVQKAEVKLSAVKKSLASYREDFSSIARRESEDGSTAPDGGAIGWLADGQIQPDLRPHISRLLKNEISSPVRLNDGWHILKCLDKREAGTPSLDEMRDKLVAQLRAERMKANSEAYVAKLLQEKPAPVDESALNQSLPPTAKIDEMSKTPTQIEK